MGWGERLFEFDWEEEGVGAYSRWALIRGWALIRINTVIEKSFPPGCLNLAQFKYITFYAEDAFIQKNVYSQKS